METTMDGYWAAFFDAEVVFCLRPDIHGGLLTGELGGDWLAIEAVMQRTVLTIPAGDG